MNGPTTDATENPDLYINRTLAALSQSQPSPKFQDRLLRSLDPPSVPFHNGAISAGARTFRGLPGGVLSNEADMRQPSDETPGFRLWRHFWFAAVATTALATVLLALFYAAAHRRGLNPEPAQAHFITKPTVPNPPNTGTVATTPGAPSSPTASPSVKVASLPPTTSTALNAYRSPNPNHLTISLELSITAPPDPDQQATADLHAPSQPAPPLPLTAQERLVRLMLRRGEKQDLAQLDPASVTAFFTQERASFHEFFDPPSTFKDETFPTMDRTAPTPSSPTKP